MEEFIGAKSPEERKRLFLETYSEDNNDKLHNQGIMYAQNPYKRETWRDAHMIKVFNENAPKGTSLSMGNISSFSNRYSVTNGSETIQYLKTSTGPSIFNVKTTKNDLFKEILYKRDDLFMKVTPLFRKNKKDSDLAQFEVDEIYHDIIIGYFLNEMVYSYKNVLSIHFLNVIDWFQARRHQIKLTSTDDENDGRLFQIVISERADHTLLDFIPTHCKTIGNIKAIFFQVLQSLEIAQITNQFVHYDLHLNNIMMQNVSSTVLENKAFLYKRPGRNDCWWYIEKEDLNNHIVKIIDFGRSRICVPSSPSHIGRFAYSSKEDQQEMEVEVIKEKHIHDRVITWDRSEFGIPPLPFNSQIDVLTFLWSFIVFTPLSFWEEIAERDQVGGLQLMQFFQEVFDFDRINSIIDESISQTAEYSLLLQERSRTDEGKVNARNLLQCPRIGRYIFYNQDLYLNAMQTTNRITPSNILDHPFFESLKMPSMDRRSEELAKEKIIDDEIAVVSFMEDLEEVRSMTDWTQMAASVNNEQELLKHIRCESCRARTTKAKKDKNGDISAFCSDVCAEFKYMFDSKTVFR